MFSKTEYLKDAWLQCHSVIYSASTNLGKFESTNWIANISCCILFVQLLARRHVSFSLITPIKCVYTQCYKRLYFFVPQEDSPFLNSCNVEYPCTWSTSSWMRQRLSSKKNKFGGAQWDTWHLQKCTALSDPVLSLMGGRSMEAGRR